MHFYVLNINHVECPCSHPFQSCDAFRRHFSTSQTFYQICETAVQQVARLQAVGRRSQAGPSRAMSDAPALARPTISQKPKPSRQAQASAFDRNTNTIMSLSSNVVSVIDHDQRPLHDQSQQWLR